MQCNIEYLVFGHILYLSLHIKFIYSFNESNEIVKRNF